MGPRRALGKFDGRLGHRGGGLVDLGFGGADRDREADALCAAGDRGVDADDFTLIVDQGAAAVAGVDRGVGLDKVREVLAAAGELVADRDRAIERRHYAARDRLGELAERAADRENGLADLDLL